MPADAVRAFVAVEVDAALRDQITRLQEALRLRIRDVKWVAPERCHLTLRFLGNVPASSLPAIEAACRAAAAATEPFELTFAGVGAFPSPSRPRVLWMGVSSGQHDLVHLQGSVEQALAGLGEPEDRPFSAHLTLGRLRQRAAGIQEAVAPYQGCEFGHVPVAGFGLIRSVLSRVGPAYSMLGSFALGSP